jgi:hypothetical protein
MAEQRGSAADQVKALVEAAERIRAEAEAEAGRTREGVERVAERADQLSQRVDELSAGVAEAVAALKKEIEALREEAGEVPPPVEDPATRIDPDADDELIAEAEAVAARGPEVEQPAAEPEPAAAPEGARLLALKMALDGRPRDETAGYLRENFELDDPEALLDEVYARAGR